MTKQLLSFLIIVSFNLFADGPEQNTNHNNLDECIENYAMNDSTMVGGLGDCLEIYEIDTFEDCREYARTHSYKEDEYCDDIGMALNIEIYMRDRPTEFFDLLSRKSGSPTESYACSVSYDDEGNEELNSTVLLYEGDSDEPIKEDRLAQKAIVHIDRNLGFAEVNYGFTVFPFAEQRFFTNELRMENPDIKMAGFVNNEIESEHKGGTDRGPYGGGWMIDVEENHLHIFAGQYQIVFTDNCKWNDIEKLIEE